MYDIGYVYIDIHSMTIESMFIPFEDSYKLPFNPISDEYRVLNDGNPIEITPQDAEHILMHHNKDNRPTTKTQIGKIRRSIEDKFRLDGQPITFNTQGNLTEKQHTLNAIRCFPADTKFKFIVAVGIEPDCFSHTAPAKNRTPRDEVMRKDPDCKSDEYATLTAILERQGKKSLINQCTIADQWFLWKDTIRSGIATCKSFFKDTDKQVFTQIKSTLHAFAALSHLSYNEGNLRMILDQIASKVKGDRATPLAFTFYEFFRENTGDGPWGHNKAKSSLFFRILCTAIDRIKENEDGEIELGITMDTLSEIEDTSTFKKYFTQVPLTKG